MSELPPDQIVAELDRYIVGQLRAKRAVAIALRNRWRRHRLEPEIAREVLPKNILMIGPTGVGKTEISRRLARMADAPFIKVEATKFTEVGYVGRDVEQIIRDLLEIAVDQVSTRAREKCAAQAEQDAVSKIVDAIPGVGKSSAIYEQVLRGDFDQMEIEIDVRDSGSSAPAMDIPGMPSANVAFLNINEMLGKMSGVSSSKKKRKLRIAEARKLLKAEAADEMLDEDEITRQAIETTENNGIVFLDEIDKVCSGAQRGGSDISREGVQRDLLPLIEGSTVSTRRGSVDTTHILFIASGAFHVAKPSDMLPELQGRLPIRVELTPLSLEDFRRIMTAPEHSLCRQYTALMRTEGVDLSFSDDGVDRIARIAVDLNNTIEDIGARRLHTVMERVLDDLSFHADSMGGEAVVVDGDYVEKHLGDFSKHSDVNRFIL